MTIVPLDRGFAVYDIAQAAIEGTLADDGQLCSNCDADFGRGMITALARIEGRARRRGRQRPRCTSQERSTATGADKAARFLQLCDALRACRSLVARATRPG